MSAFKNLLKSDTPSSGLGAQGSHFARSNDEPTTVTGSEPQTAGPPDASAAPAPSDAARNTAGPEGTGGQHVGTVASSATSQPTGQHSSVERPQDTSSSGSAAIGTTTTYSSRPLASGDPTPSVIDHDSKDPMTYRRPEHYHSEQTESTVGGVPSGSAATAATAAWKSNDKMPGTFPGNENPYKAQSLDPRVDGGRAVSGNSPTPTRGTGTGLASGGIGAGAGAGVGTGALAGATTAHHREQPSTTQSSTGPAASSLTSTADPTDRAATYSGATSTQGLDNRSTVTPHSTTPASSSFTDPSTTRDTAQPAIDEQPGVASKVLGALGLGGAAATAASALGYGSNTEGAGEPHDTSAIATQPGQVSQETGPGKHYRRESIPTTAYPGPSAAQPIAAPVGGTRPSISENTSTATHAPSSGVGAGTTAGSAVPRSSEYARDVSAAQPHSTVHDQITMDPSQTCRDLGSSHTGRDVAAGGALGAAAGAGAYAVHERQEDHGLAGTGVSGSSAPGPSVPHHPKETYTTSSSAGTQPTSSTFGTTALPDRSRESPIDAVAAAPGRYDGQDAEPVGYTTFAGTTSTLHDAERRDDHTGRNTAIGAGAGAAAAGGAAYAVHDKELEKQREHERKEMEKAQHKHEKELEKEQKHHQKELEKQHTKEEKAHEKAEKHHQKELEKQHSKEERAHQKELEREEEPQKKPSIFKRIFKRRQNKDTGEDEEYSTDEEAEHATHGGAVPIHHSSTKDRNVLGAAGTTTVAAEHRDPTTGLAYDPSKDPEAARRLSREPGADAPYGRGTDAAPAGSSTGTGLAGTTAGEGLGSSGTGHHIPTPTEVGNLGVVGDHKR